MFFRHQSLKFLLLHVYSLLLKNGDVVSIYWFSFYKAAGQLAIYYTVSCTKFMNTKIVFTFSWSFSLHKKWGFLSRCVGHVRIIERVFIYTFISYKTIVGILCVVEFPNVYLLPHAYMLKMRGRCCLIQLEQWHQSLTQKLWFLSTNLLISCRQYSIR